MIIADKINKFLILPLIILSACTMEYEPQVKSAGEAITIVNDAKNTSWYIGDSNIADIEPMTISYNDTIVLDNIDKVDTIVFNGGIQSNNIELFNGNMYVPFSNTIILSNCRDSANNKILYPIDFDVDVKDWKD